MVYLMIQVMKPKFLNWKCFFLKTVNLMLSEYVMTTVTSTKLKLQSQKLMVFSNNLILITPFYAVT